MLFFLQDFISPQIIPINTESVWRETAAMQPGEREKMSREKGERGKKTIQLKVPHVILLKLLLGSAY